MAVEELGLAVVVTGMAKFLSDMKTADGAVDSTGKKWSGLSGIAGTAFKAIGTAAVAGFAAVAAAVGAAGIAVFKFAKDSVQMATDFQSQLAILSVAAKDSGMSLEELGDVALEVGGDTRLLGVSASGSADAMTGLYKAGLSTTEIFGDLQGYMAGTSELGGALRASIDLAAASELDMVQASDLAAITLASFGGELETEAERAEFVNMAMNNMVQAADASVAEVSGLADALKMVAPTAGQMGISIQDVNNGLALLSTRGIQGSMAGTSLNRMLLDLTKTTPKAADMMDDLGISIYDQQGAMLPLVDIIGQFEGALGDATAAERDAALQAIFTAQGQRAMNTLLSEGVEGWEGMAAATAAAAGIQEQAAVRAETYAGKMEALEGTIETLKIEVGMALLPILQDLADWFMQMVDQYGPMVVEAFQWIADIIMQLLPQFFSLVDFLANQLPAAATGLQEVWATIWPQIQEIAQIFVMWFQENLPLIIETGQVMLDFWQNSVVPTLDNVWTIIVETVTVAINTVMSIITLIMQVITGDWEGAWTTIQEIASTIWQAILTIVSEFIEGVANFIGTTTEEIKATWQADWEMAKLIVTTIWENILSAIQEKLQAVYQSIVDKVEEAKSWLQSQVSAWRSVGEALIDGVKEGVLAAAGRLAQAAIDAVRRALDAAKAAIGIGSPSEVFRRQVGEPIGQGIALGVADLAPTIQRQIVAAVSPGGGGGRTMNVANTSTANFNLTTQSITRPGALAMEFSAMELAYSATR